mgnify:FL=1
MGCRGRTARAWGAAAVRVTVMSARAVVACCTSTTALPVARPPSTRARASMVYVPSSSRLMEKHPPRFVGLFWRRGMVMPWASRTSRSALMGRSSGARRTHPSMAPLPMVTGCGVGDTGSRRAQAVSSAAARTRSVAIRRIAHLLRLANRRPGSRAVIGMRMDEREARCGIDAGRGGRSAEKREWMGVEPTRAAYAAPLNDFEDRGAHRDSTTPTQR